MKKPAKKTAGAREPEGRGDEGEWKITVRYSADMLDAINERAAKLGVTRVNLLRADIAENLEWEHDPIEPTRDTGEPIPVTIRMPRRMFEAFDRAAARKGIDRASLARMWTIEKTKWQPK